jgi:hypothetical protein
MPAIVKRREKSDILTLGLHIKLKALIPDKLVPKA